MQGPHENLCNYSAVLYDYGNLNFNDFLPKSMLPLRSGHQYIRDISPVASEYSLVFPKVGLAC